MGWCGTRDGLVARSSTEKQLMQASRKTKVLVVDGHPVVVSGCRAIFANDRSVQIISAANEREGLEAYRQSRPHVAIIDVKLPDLSGYELLRKIRKEDPEARVIMFSMNDDPAFVVRAVELGAKGFLCKGDDTQNLVDAVREVAKGTTFVSPELAQSITFASSEASCASGGPTQQQGTGDSTVARQGEKDRTGRRCARLVI